MKYPQVIVDLIEDFKKLPSIGTKTAERLVMFLYSQSSVEDLNLMADNLVKLKQSVHKCPVCGNLTEGELCDICQDDSRDKQVIMVVEVIKDLFVIERLGEFRGVYHVLGGAISFSNGIGVDDLAISDLLKRIKDNNIKEVILATNANVDGETTARYIKALIDDSCLVTRIAHGLPVGSDMQYADEMTLLKALEGRRDY